MWICHQVTFSFWFIRNLAIFIAFSIKGHPRATSQPRKMDLLQGNFTFPLSNIHLTITDYALNLYNTYNHPALLYARRTLTYLQSQLLPLITPYAASLYDLLANSPQWVAITVFVIFIFLLLQLLVLIQRIAMYPMRLAWYLTKIGLLVGVLAMVWQRGWEQSLEDVGRLAEGCRKVAVFWWRQWEMWGEKERGAREYGQARTFGGGGQRRGAGRWN